MTQVYFTFYARNGDFDCVLRVTGIDTPSMSDLIPQDRSPRSPSLPLSDSISLVAKLFDAIRTATVMPEIAIKPLGYGSTNGAAMTTLATLAQYGLVDRTGGKLFVTPLAVRIMHPKSDDQRDAAIRDAALSPKVMNEIYEGYLECAESVIAGHLIQSGFNTDRAKKVASIHVANKSFAKLSCPENTNESDSFSLDEQSSENNDLTGGAPTVLLKIAEAQQPHVTSKQQSTVLAQYTIPLGANEATLVFSGKKLSSDDFDALTDFVEFAKKQFNRAQKSSTQEPAAPLNINLELPSDGG